MYYEACPFYSIASLFFQGPKGDDGKSAYMESEMISAKHKLLEAREMLEKNEKVATAEPFLNTSSSER